MWGQLDLKEMNIRAQLTALLLLITASEAMPAAAPEVSSGRLLTINDFESDFVPARDIFVWLPEDYSEDRRYAVLYMHDGDSLWDAATTWNGQEWGVDEVVSGLLEEGAIRDVIVVGIPNAGSERGIEYLPQKPFEAMAPEDQQALYAIEHPELGRVYSGPIRSDAYLRFLVEELKPHIDANFPTLPDRDNTVVMGSSMGGLISIYAISEYPEVFGGAGCLSTHWPGSLYPGDSPFPALMRDYLKDNIPEPDGHYLWFDYGSEGLDASYAGYQSRVDHIVRNKGYGNDRWITFLDAGADHNEDAWRARLHHPLTFLLAPRPAAPAVLATVASPDGRNEFSLVIDHSGISRYSVRRGGQVVVSDSRLGLRFAEQAELGKGFRLTTTERSSRDETWEQPWGERRLVRDHHNELLVRFEDDALRRFDLRVRAFNDGIGFRYEVPGQPGFETANIVDELTEFSLPEGSTAWWIPGRRYNRYEYLYRTTGVDEVETAHTPMTLRTAGGVHLSIHEAALTDYAAFVLDQRRDRVFQANLTPWSDGIRVKASAPFKTPWRTIQLADDAVGLLNSSLILNLNEPNALGDVSWVEPGKYVGIWWAMHIRKRTWGSGPIHGATTGETKRYMDFAAKYGFDGVLVEGWNIGWDGDWFHNGDLFRFDEPYPDFDIRAVGEYGRQKGVRLIGHHETSGSVTNYAEQMDAAFDLYESVGVRQVKTGYVADGGDIKRVDEDGRVHYEWHDGQFTVGEYLRSVTEAAKRRISINTHEPVKDTGLRRTYPNWLTREGAKGQEFNAWGVPPNSPEHTVILAYTRLLSGPMDFTPGIFDLTPFGMESQHRVQTTLAKQLALYVTVYSPVQMAADLPENYEARPDAFQFIVDVPADWEESIAVAGEVGDYVVFARQERGGPDWYLGAITDEEPRELEIPLGFLEPGRRYSAQIYRDGYHAHWRTNPYALEIETREVGRDDVLKLRLAPGGGTAIRFEAEAR
jgi:alpha-glucosidase